LLSLEIHKAAAIVLVLSAPRDRYFDSVQEELMPPPSAAEDTLSFDEHYHFAQRTCKETAHQASLSCRGDLGTTPDRSERRIEVGWGANNLGKAARQQVIEYL